MSVRSASGGGGKNLSFSVSALLRNESATLPLWCSDGIFGISLGAWLLVLAHLASFHTPCDEDAASLICLFFFFYLSIKK